jgi:hypothetical protein
MTAQCQMELSGVNRRPDRKGGAGARTHNPCLTLPYPAKAGSKQECYSPQRRRDHATTASWWNGMGNPGRGDLDAEARREKGPSCARLVRAALASSELRSPRPSCARIGKLKRAPPKQSELRSDGQARRPILQPSDAECGWVSGEKKTKNSATLTTTGFVKSPRTEVCPT